MIDFPPSSQVLSASAISGAPNLACGLLRGMQEERNDTNGGTMHDDTSSGTSSDAGVTDPNTTRRRNPNRNGGTGGNTGGTGGNTGGTGSGGSQ